MNFLIPIFAVFVLLPSASHSETFGAWLTGVTDTGDGFFAATINDSGSLLGQYCFPLDGSCLWVLGISTGCSEGDQYPVLANSDAGAAHLSVYCTTRLDNELYRYAFSEFDAIQDIVTKGARVGFAVPLQSDQFRVFRFDLRGANLAVSSMRAAAAQAHDEILRRGAGARDQNL